jgi:CBS domain containing-hemolysin-like protein
MTYCDAGFRVGRCCCDALYRLRHRLVAAAKTDLSAGSVQGIITRKEIMDALAGDIEVFGV